MNYVGNYVVANLEKCGRYSARRAPCRAAMTAQAGVHRTISGSRARRHSRTYRCIALLLLGLADASAAEMTTDLRAFVLAGACFECHAMSEHQPHETGDAAIPTLGGRTAEDILTVLMEYRGGTRSGTIMPRLARGYDAAELSEIATWLAQQGGPWQ